MTDLPVISTKKVVHNYMDQYWGHALQLWENKKKNGKDIATSCGHGTVEKGDLIVLKVPSGFTIYEITKLDYYRDPPDMFSAEYRRCDEAAQCDKCKVVHFSKKHKCSDPVEKPAPKVRFLR